MKLIVSTFLVYKVKKCLLKSGKVSMSTATEKGVSWTYDTPSFHIYSAP